MSAYPDCFSRVDPPLTMLEGVYDFAGSDKFYGRRMSEWLGAEYRFVGSDGAMHRGVVVSIFDGTEYPADGSSVPCNVRAVLRTGYSHLQTISLQTVAALSGYPCPA